MHAIKPDVLAMEGGGSEIGWLRLMCASRDSFRREEEVVSEGNTDLGHQEGGAQRLRGRVRWTRSAGIRAIAKFVMRQPRSGCQEPFWAQLTADAQETRHERRVTMDREAQVRRRKGVGSVVRFRSRSALLVGFAVVAFVGLTTTAQATPSTKAAKKPVLTWGYSRGPTNLNPALNSYGTGGITTLAYEPIVHINPDGTYSPGLATTWKYVPGSGNTVFEFTLRHNARFSDGNLVTAPGVVAWFRYFYSANGPQHLLLGANPTFSSAGKWTVEMKLTKPNPNVLFILSNWSNWGCVADPKAFANPSVMATKTFGAGPYVILPSQTVSGNQYTYLPNKYYYDPTAIHFSKVVVKAISNPTTMLEALKAGQLDVAWGDPSTVNAASQAGFKVVAAPSDFDVLVLADRAGTISPLGKLAVRQAISYAINRDAITKSLIGKWGVASSEIYATDGWVQNLQHYYSYNPAKAKALLSQAGYPNGFTLNILDDNFEGVLSDPMVQAVAQDLSAVGIQTKITTAADPNTYVADIASKTFPAFAEDGGINPYSNFFSSWFSPGGPANPFNYDDPTLDALYNKAVTAANPVVYNDQITKRIVTQAYLVAIWNNDEMYYVKKGVYGVAFSPRNHFPWAVDWYEK